MITGGEELGILYEIVRMFGWQGKETHEAQICLAVGRAAVRYGG